MCNYFSFFARVDIKINFLIEGKLLLLLWSPSLPNEAWYCLWWVSTQQKKELLLYVNNFSSYEPKGCWREAWERSTQSFAVNLQRAFTFLTFSLTSQSHFWPTFTCKHNLIWLKCSLSLSSIFLSTPHNYFLTFIFLSASRNAVVF